MFSHPKGFLIKDAIFDSASSKFIILQVENEDSQESLMILVTDDHSLRFFDSIPINEQHLTNSAYPTIYLSGYGSDNSVEVKRVLPRLYHSLMSNGLKNAQSQEFFQDISFSLSYEKLEECVGTLRKMEVGVNVEEFWVSLLQIALKNRNV